MTNWIIVEDEPDVFEVLMLMVEIFDVEGLAFIDGEEAVDWIDDVDNGYFHGEVPAIAILDLRLPGNIQGQDVGNRLRHSPILRDIIIIIITAYKFGPEEESHILQYTQANRIIYKPIPRAQDFNKIIDELFNNNSKVIKAPKNASIINDYNKLTENKSETTEITDSSNNEFRQNILSTPKTILIISQKPISLPVTHKIEVVNSSKIFEKIAKSSIDIIIIDETELHNLEQITSFDLATNIPIIATLNTITFENYFSLINRGVNSILANNANKQELDSAISKKSNDYYLPSPLSILLSIYNPFLEIEVLDILEKNYLVNCSFAHSHSSVLDKVQEKAPNIIIIHSDIYHTESFFSELSEISPISYKILITHKDFPNNIFQNYNKFNIIGVIPETNLDKFLITIMDQLWNPVSRNLNVIETWNKYQLRKTEKQYELRLLKTNPELAFCLRELDARFKGIFHDLRNVLSSAIALSSNNLEKNAIRYAIILLECLSNLRFKGSWNAKILTNAENTGFTNIISDAIDIVKMNEQSRIFDIEITISEDFTFIGDYSQLVDSFVSLLMSNINEYSELHISITQTNKQEISIQIEGGKWEIFSLHSLTQKLTFDQFLLLNAYKLLSRHNATCLFHETKLLIILPIQKYGDETTLRENIAVIAKSINQYTDRIKKVELSTKSEYVSTFIKSITTRLLEFLDNIYLIVNPEMQLKVKYASLLARNMLESSTDEPNISGHIPLNMLFETVLALNEKFLRKIQTHISITPVDLTIQSNELSLLQILSNLITNAVESMDGKGNITLSATEHSQQIIIKVSDTGKGIKNEHIETIFNVYYSTKSGNERGIGLYVVKSLLNTLGGKLNIQSEVTVGTTFTISLPKIGHTNMRLAPHQLLVIEDESIFLEEYIEQLQISSDYQIDGAEDIDDARSLIAQKEYSVILTDIKLNTVQHGGLEILEEVKRKYPDTQVIVFSGIAGTIEVRQAQRLRVDGYLPKPLDFDRLRQVVQDAVKFRDWRKQIRNERVGKPQEEDKLHLPTPEPFRYACQSMHEIANKATKFALLDNHVYIYGEAGTGKGLIAEGIHFGSNREQFELVNCGSLSDLSLERILFGYFNEQIKQRRKGLIERLNGGTLVLDRITGLSLRLQEKLVQVLTSGSVTHSEGNTSVDIRIIGIDEKDLGESVKHNLFSKSLFDLITGSILYIPSLRSRYDDSVKDTLILADYFIEKYATETERESIPELTSEVENILESYPFPGNVAELENTIRISLQQSETNQIKFEDLPPKIQQYGTRIGFGKQEENLSLPVLCPHGSFYCNKTQLIADNFVQSTNIYIRITTNEISQQHLAEQIKNLGLNALFPQNFLEPLVALCNYCAPIQSCHFAIFDVSIPEPQIIYEIGLLHALGIPTLVVTNNISSQHFPLQVNEIYKDESEFINLTNNWLRSMI